MRFHADRIDAFLRSLSRSEVVQALDYALFFEVDRGGPPGLRHRQAFGHVVNRDHLLGAEQDGAADAELTHRSAAPIATVSVGSMSHWTTACQPVGKCR